MMTQISDDQIGGRNRSQNDGRAYDAMDDRAGGDPDEIRQPDASLSEAGNLSAEEPTSDPAVHPAPQFRSDLLRALEETHRQQAARRVLGAHYSVYQQQLDEQRRQRWLLALLTALAALLVFVAIRRRQGWEFPSMERHV
jgi:hypothetical protein